MAYYKENKMKIGDTVFFCDVVPNCSTYEILELILRTVADGYCVGVDTKTKQAHLFTNNMVDKYVFTNRSEAIEALKIFRLEDEKDD